MPFPHWVARANKRFTNRFIEPVTRRSRHYAVVHHRGRVSGNTYRTPVFVFWGKGHGYVALTYGPNADWVQNVLSGGRQCHHSTTVPINNPIVVGRQVAWDHLPQWVRFFLRILRVTDFVEFTRD